MNCAAGCLLYVWRKMSGLAQRCTNPGRLLVLMTNLIDISASYFRHTYCRFLPVVPKYVMHRAASAGWLWGSQVTVGRQCGTCCGVTLRAPGIWIDPKIFFKCPNPRLVCQSVGSWSPVVLSVCLSVCHSTQIMLPQRTILYTLFVFKYVGFLEN